MQPPRLPKDSERRQATVLFADIAGFTAMSEKLDPEEVTNLVNRCFAMLASAVAAHGGHVDKYIGDCVMALFGVPAALEKAPQQAINAAIEMRNRLAQMNQNERLAVPLELHIGINTGLVIAGHVGGEVKQEFTVMGDAVNVASRLKDAAPHGAIWVGPQTHRYAREEFEFRKLPPLSVKGKEQALDAYELTSVTERVHRLKPAAERMISSPLVGRDAELGLLRASVAAVVRGEGGIAHLIGEAGLGKSRLLAEVSAAEEAKATLVLEGRSLSIGHGLSFHPFVDLLQQWAGIAEEDTEPQRQAKLETAVGAIFPAETGEIFPFIATLMGMRLTGAHAARIEGIAGEAMEKLIVRSMRHLLQRLAAAKPLVLVFEDLHWADLSSIQLLESLLRLVTDQPILFIHAFRPDHPETSGRILDGARDRFGRQQMEVSLEPLSERGAATLVRNLLKTEDVPYPVLARIARTGEGNPFYIEEIVRSLIDEGAIEQVRGRLAVTRKIDEVVVPDTIQGVIMARVDRLDEPTRQVLQIASVLGRSFYYRLLAEIVPPGVDLDTELGRLKERELLLERRTRRTATVRRSTLAEELEYVFHHALVQETIYESILQRTRKELHQRVAHAIEATFAERLPDFYGMLAYHFSRAEDVVKAEEYLFKAGDEAARSAASSEALAFFREASKLYFLMHGEGGDPRRKALLEKNIGLALLNKGQLLESVEHFDRALEHLGEHVPRGTLAVGARFSRDLAAVLFHVYVRPGRHGSVKDLDHERAVCELLFYRGRAEITSDPRRLFLETVPSGLRRFNRIDPRHIEHACSIYVSCAGVFAYSGISFALSERMLGIASTVVREGSVRDRFIYREASFILHYLQGHWDDAHAIEDELVEQALRYGEVLDVTNYLGLDADRRLRRGDFGGARRVLEKLVEINDAYGYGFAGTSHDGYLTLLLLEERNVDKALRLAESYAAGRHEYAMQVFALGVIAKLRLLRGEREAAATALARAEEIAAQSPLVSPWHQSTYLLSRLLFDVTALEECLQQGDRAGGRRHARAARRSARRALRLTRKVAKERIETYKLAGRLAWLLGKPRRALAWWGKSIAEGEQMGARPELARTYVEVGQRLGEPSSRVLELGSMSAASCLERAEQLLVEMHLDWDIEQLKGITGPAHARTGGERWAATETRA